MEDMDLLDLTFVWETDEIDTEVVGGIITVRGDLAYKTLHWAINANELVRLTPVLGDLVDIGQQSLVQLLPSLARCSSSNTASQGGHCNDGRRDKHFCWYGELVVPAATALGRVASRRACLGSFKAIQTSANAPTVCERVCVACGGQTWPNATLSQANVPAV